MILPLLRAWKRWPLPEARSCRPSWEPPLFSWRILSAFPIRRSSSMRPSCRPLLCGSVRHGGFRSGEEGNQGGSKGRFARRKNGVEDQGSSPGPIILLVYYIMLEYNLMTATFRTMIFIVLVGFLRRATWMSLTKILNAFTRGRKRLWVWRSHLPWQGSWLA